MKDFGKFNRNSMFGTMIFLGIVMFDFFNFATTVEAIASFGLADMAIFGLKIALKYPLALAFCSIDLGGVSSIFTKEKGFEEPWWVWLMGVGWLIASGINAFLTWVAISLTMANAPVMQHPILKPEDTLFWIPVIMAVAVFLIRVLIIGSIVAAGNHVAPKPIKRPEFKTEPKINIEPVRKPEPKPVPQMNQRKPEKTPLSSGPRLNPIASQPTKEVPAPMKAAPPMQKPQGTISFSGWMPDDKD